MPVDQFEIPWLTFGCVVAEDKGYYMIVLKKDPPNGYIWISRTQNGATKTISLSKSFTYIGYQSGVDENWLIKGEGQFEGEKVSVEALLRFEPTSIEFEYSQAGVTRHSRKCIWAPNFPSEPVQ